MIKHWAPKSKLVPGCVISLNGDLQLIDVWPLPCLIGLLAALLPLSWPMQFTFWSFMLSFSGSAWIWKIAPRKCHCTVFFPLCHPVMCTPPRVWHSVMDRQLHDKDKDRGQRLATVEQKGVKETESRGNSEWDIWVWYFHSHTLVSSSSFFPPRDRIC